MQCNTRQQGGNPHPAPIAGKIPDLDSEAEILLLVGRDAPPLHKIHESWNGPRNPPWAQHLDLGWVVLGNACLDGAHKPREISTYRTQVLENGPPTFLEPRINRFYIEHDTGADIPAYLTKKETFLNGRFEDGLGDNIFLHTKDDNKPGTSAEDRKFLEIMNHSVVKNDAGSWEAPLPLREPSKQLPNNRK